MGQWWCGPVTVTAGVGDKGAGGVGVSQQRKERQGVRCHSQRETPFVPSKRLPDLASLELSPSVESCGCGDRKSVV